MKRACHEPVSHIVGNAGWEGAIVIEKILANNRNYGFTSGGCFVVVRHLENFGRLLVRQSSEEPEFHRLFFAMIDPGEQRKRLVDILRIQTGLGRERWTLIERNVYRPRAALGPLPDTCVVHKDVPHNSGSDREEVDAIVPVGLFGVDQAQVDLVDERRGIQRGSRPLFPRRCLAAIRRSRSNRGTS